MSCSSEFWVRHLEFYSEQYIGHQYYYRIDRDGRIKVTDFGLTEDMYGTNYYRQEKVAGENEERLPIRWMAPESIENNLYNESTDVVSLQPGNSVQFIVFIFQLK